MAFQASVDATLASGVIGDIVLSGAVRSQPGILATATVANNVIGRAVTHKAGEDGVFVVGGSGAFAGILTNSKQYALQGGLTPSLNIPNSVPVEATYLATGIIVELDDAANIGQAVFYKTADGTLHAADSGSSPSGYTEIAGSKVVRCNTSAAGIAIISLTA